MEIIIIGIIVLALSYFFQILCIKSAKKIVKAIPTICIIIFAIVSAREYYLSQHGGAFFGFEVQSPFDMFGLVIAWAICIISLIGAALGVVLAWITHGIKYMLQKREDKV